MFEGFQPRYVGNHKQNLLQRFAASNPPDATPLEIARLNLTLGCLIRDHPWDYVRKAPESIGYEADALISYGTCVPGTENLRTETLTLGLRSEVSAAEFSERS